MKVNQKKQSISQSQQHHLGRAPQELAGMQVSGHQAATRNGRVAVGGSSNAISKSGLAGAQQLYHATQGGASGVSNQQILLLTNQNARQDNLRGAGPQSFSKSAHKIPCSQFVPQFQSPHLGKGGGKMVGDHVQSHQQLPGSTQVRNQQSSYHQGNRGQLIGGLGDPSQHHQSHQVLLQQQHLGGLNSNSKSQINAGIVEQILYPSTSKKGQSGKSGGGKAGAQSAMAQQQRLAQAQINYQSNPSQHLKFVNVNQTASNAKSKQQAGQSLHKNPSHAGAQPKAKSRNYLVQPMSGNPSTSEVARTQQISSHGAAGVGLQQTSMNKTGGNGQFLTQQQLLQGRSSSQQSAQSAQALNLQNRPLPKNSRGKKPANQQHQQQYEYDLTAYNDPARADIETTLLKFSSTQISGSKKNGGSEPGSKNASITRGVAGRQDLNGSRNQGTTLKNSKSLYTNISLREISQSPDRVVDGGGGLHKNKSKKILITSDKLTNQQALIQRKQVQQMQSKRLGKNTSAGVIENLDQMIGDSWQAHAQSQNQFQQFDSQHGASGFQASGQIFNGSGTHVVSQPRAPTSDQKGAILNIKTVDGIQELTNINYTSQDINIYNNSFIVNTNGDGLPQNIQAQAQMQLQQNPGQQIQQLMQQQAPTQQRAPSNKKGLKLRKDLSAMSSGFGQSRSASQGRGPISGVSSASNQRVAGPEVFHNQSYGAISTDQQATGAQAYDSYLQSSQERGSQVINHLMSHPNIANFQQNPNQKRVLSNPSGKLFGNLAAITGIKNGGGLAQKQRLQHLNPQLTRQAGAYQQSQKQGIKKILKNKLSSNTSRPQSRTESRGPILSQKGGEFEQNWGHLSSSNLQGNARNPGHGLGGRPAAPLETGQQHHQNQLQLMYTRELGATAAEGRTDVNVSNLSNQRNDLTASGLSNIHSNSQMVLSQLHQSQKYNKLAPNIDNKNSQASYSMAGQLKNLNSYEVRKQSLQDLRNANQPPNHKFRNQVMQVSSDQERMTPNAESGLRQVGLGSSGQINYSMSLKNDQYFQNRGGIMNRVNTQGDCAEHALDQAASPVRQRLESLASKALKDCEEAQARLIQVLARLKRGLTESRGEAVSESDLCGTSSQLSALRDEIGALEEQVSQASKDYTDIDQARENFQRISSELSVLGDEATIIEALCMLDQGQTHEAIRELEKICAQPRLEFNRSLSEELQQPLEIVAGAQANLRISLLAKAIVQKKVGDHEEALDTLTSCIAQFGEFKDAYLVRGQTYLLRNKAQRALQDFIKFDSLANLELDQLLLGNQHQPQIIYATLQFCLGKESLGDAYKKMKKYKLSDKSYRESLKELEKLARSPGERGPAQERVEHQRRKISMKIAMCAYYYGDMQQAIDRFQEIIFSFKTYDQEDFRVQQVLMKCNFYCAKAILALKESHSHDGDPGYQRALIHLQYCCSDEIDPELHELYSGNAFFEIAKVFLRQKDVLNAHDFIQRATDNNYNSKRLSLYRDFAEGVVQLMKRKIKRGVQILTDVLEVLLNGQRELNKQEDKKEKGEAAFAENKQKNRYNVNESESGLPSAAGQSENMDEDQSTINGKANQVASGKFTQEMYDYLVFNIYMYRSYGYVAIEKYEHALEDLRKAKKISAHSIDRATVYNKWLSRGILKMDTEEYLMASKYFGKASLRFPENKDSFCLNTISIVRSYSYSMASQFIDDQVKKDKVEQTRKFLDEAIASCCKEQKQASLFFFRGLLNFQLHCFYEALRDFNVAISEEEEATGQFHLARGRCFACLSMLDEALNDLTVALELDDSLLEAYIFRGKCAYLHGDNNLAFHDFQKLIISDQKNPIVHIYAGNLLMTTGAYPDAIKAFDNADTVQQTALAAFQRIRCYCALSDLERAFEQMQLCMHLAPGEKLASYDYKVLLPLLSCVRSFDFSKGEDGQPDEAGLAEQRAILNNCVAQITSIIEAFEQGEHQKLTKGQSPMSIQIIPNVNKIKLEKQFVQLAKAKRSKDDSMYPSLSAEEQAELDEVEAFGYYRENIFQLEEMYLYRSIFNTYLGNIDHAIADLNRSWKAHYRATQQAKLGGSKATTKDAGLGVTTDLTEELFGKFSTSQLVSPMSMASQQSQKSDLSDIGLCSLNVREYNYNMIINLVQARNWAAALKKINEELTQSPANAEQAKSIKQLYLLRAMVHQELGQTDKHNQDLTIYLKNFQSLQKNSQGAVVLEPFEAKGRLCQYFEPLKMNFSIPKTKGGFSIMMRPSFSMPFMKPPNMIPNIDEEAIQNEFNLKQIDAPMPEAPWTRHCLGQQFEPFNYLQEAQAASDQERAKGPGLPYRYGKPQQFITKYCGQDRQLIYDDKVAEDIDDLSDTEKVSLISDVELIKEEYNEKPRQENIENSLGLKDMNKLNQDIIQQKKSKVSSKHNGVEISKQKYLCGRRNSCTSCYRQEGNLEVLRLTAEAEQEDGCQVQNIKSQGKVKTDVFYDDTVSEEEYGSSSESQSQSAESKDKQKKKDGQSYSHSRFSSNIEGLEEELNQLGLISEMGCGIRDQDTPADIDGADIQVGQNQLKKDKSQLLDPDAQLLNREMLKEKVFNQRIGSIQDHADQLVDFQPDPGSPPKKIAQVKDGDMADSMVLIGSKNLEKMGPKKKSKKIGGTNLKKNKLAIAFNNLEMEQNHEQ